MKPRPSVSAQPGGPTTVDALLEICRPLTVFSPTVHSRVKRRLNKTLARWSAPRARWLKPVVMTGALLLAGVASGLALDRIVLRRPSAIEGTAGVSDPTEGRARTGKTGSHRKPSPTHVSPPAEIPAATDENLKASPAPVSSAPEKDKSLPMPMGAASRRLAKLSPETPNHQVPPRPAVEPSPPQRQAETISAHASTVLPAPKQVWGAPVAPPAQPIAAPVSVPARITLPPSAPATLPAQPSPPQAGAPSEERMLAAALRALRSQSDAPTALAALDEYRARYPLGRLSVEADTLRASALLALDRRDEALRVLDGIELAHVPGGAKRLLQRAELRASAGRWQDAIADFDAVFARVAHGELAERALWGRAQARLAAGDRTGAQRDAVLYLQHHPTGPFAGAAARLARTSP